MSKLCYQLLFMGIINESGQNFHGRIGATVLEELLKSEILKIRSEDNVVLVVKKWLHFDMRGRKTFAPQLLKQIRFGKVSKELLEKFQNDASYLMNVEC